MRRYVSLRQTPDPRHALSSALIEVRTVARRGQEILQADRQPACGDTRAETRPEVGDGSQRHHLSPRGVPSRADDAGGSVRRVFCRDW